MNFKSGLRALKKLSVGLLVLGWATVPQKAWAGPFGTVRSITSNNIYQCSTGSSWELVQGNSNMRGTNASFSMGCLNPDGTARWIIKAEYRCKEGFCTLAKNYINPPYNQITGTYTRNLPTAVAGIDCQLKKSSNEWVCKKLVPYKDMMVKTVGDEKGEYYGVFMSRYGSLPTIQYPIVPNSPMQAEILKI